MLFVSFFWAYFHSSLAPSIELSLLWPPLGINEINPWGIPLLGSIVLLSSGFVVTLSHHALLLGHKSDALIYYL
jgi:cytochrome c oxidase subunit 3